MPKMKDTPKKFPPLDILKACMLDRKLSMHVTYDDLAAVADTSPDYIRKLITTKHTSEWNPEIRRAISNFLGLRTQLTFKDMNEDNY